jgi:kinesin family protein C2/C3
MALSTQFLLHQVTIQMFQLYRDGLEDLLAGLNHKKKTNLDAAKRSNGQLKITLAEHSPTGLVHVEGAESILAESAQDVMSIFQTGAARRTTASTQMNAESSRSHLICTLIITLVNRKSGVTTTGKLTLVDLAGSEVRISLIFCTHFLLLLES